jgi:peptidoglycan/xylan/chitin deacetylase (PgdA/CDA1 family)
MYKITTIILVLLFMTSGTIYPAAKVILKLDDAGALNGKVDPNFKRAMEYLIQNQIKFSIGIYGRNVDNLTKNALEPFINATDSLDNNLCEVWHHGLDHIIPEFSGHPYSYQKEHFDKMTQLIKDKLGIQMHSFGTPGITSDSVTNKVISEDPNYKVFMLSTISPPVPNGVLYLYHNVPLEIITGNPSYDSFVNNYNYLQNIYKDYMIIQGHPNSWNDERFEQFKRVIDFLKLKKVEFVLPYDYYRSLTLKNPYELKAQLLNTSKVKLTWYDNSNLLNNYKIDSSEDGIKWKLIATCQKDCTSYIDEKANSLSGQRLYRVFANCGILSNASNIAIISNLSTNVNQIKQKNNFEINIHSEPLYRRIQLKIYTNQNGLFLCNIFNIGGKLVKNVFKNDLTVGSHEINIDTSNLLPGMYLLNLNSRSGSITKKIIISK